MSSKSKAAMLISSLPFVASRLRRQVGGDRTAFAAITARLIKLHRYFNRIGVHGFIPDGALFSVFHDRDIASPAASRRNRF
jgi:hypothetical protein